MANRVLRDWTTSEVVDVLSPQAEVFFTRLIMKADDYGSYFANPMLLKSGLFPLRNNTVNQIESQLSECVKSGLVFRYSVDGKDYIRIHNFGQRLRNMRGTFPQPDDNSRQLAADGGELRPETETKQKRNETETESETEGVAANVCVWPSFDDFWILYGKKVDRAKCEAKWKKIEQKAREKIMQHLEMYIRSTPDIQYRRHPLTYLSNNSWENEIIIKSNNGITADGTRERLDSYTD